jgi:hypothetical protein
MIGGKSLALFWFFQSQLPAIQNTSSLLEHAIYPRQFVSPLFFLMFYRTYRFSVRPVEIQRQLCNTANLAQGHSDGSGSCALPIRPKAPINRTHLISTGEYVQTVNIL